MTFLKKIMNRSFSLCFLFFTPLAYASSPVQAPPLPRCPAGMYDLLAPVGTFAGGTCYTLTEYLNGIFTTVIGIAGLLAVVMIVVCGIKFVAGASPGAKSEAKECIFNALLGVLIAIGSWLLLNTINPQLLKNDAEITVQASSTQGVSQNTPVDDPMPTQPSFLAGFYYRYKGADGKNKNSPVYNTNDICTAAMKGAQDSGKILAPGPDGVTVGCFNLPKTVSPAAAGLPAAAGEDTTRNLICGNNSCVPNAKNPTNSTSNVYINKPPCIPYNANYKDCAKGTGTNVGGLDSGAGAGTVQAIKDLAAACGCQVTITGGTEAGHVSHGANVPVFDLTRTSELLTFVKNNATIKSNPSFCSPSRTNGVCFKKWLYKGYWYTDETDAEAFGIKAHWHVCKEGTPPDISTPAKISVFTSACNKS